MRNFLVIPILALVAASCCPPPKPASCCHAKPKPEPIMHVVMVHGFLERGNNFQNMRNRLEAKQVACHVVRLKPSDGRHGICNQADSLKEQIEEKLGPDQSFSLIGFSMGGLVCRYYLQNLGGAARCDKLITISTPHHGTWLANLYFGKGAQQMRRGSDFLRQLEASEERLGDMPITSYHTPLDLIILPPSSSVWKRAENRKHYVIAHPLMVYIPSVLNDIEKRLLE